MKPFKSYNEQIDVLKERGLIVGEEALYDLENENYYNIINGYKDLFLKLQPDSREPIVPETFIDGARFEEIFALYKLDRRLRNTLLEYLLVFETHIKSRISYYFSQKYKEPHSYLYFMNYSSDNNLTKKVVDNVATLSNIMAKKNKGPIKHYINCHDGVPFWVLINYLTIGNVSYLYEVLEKEIKESIAKSYSEKFKRQYSLHTNIQFNDVQSIIKQVNFFRNVCAHEERLYDYKMYGEINVKNMMNMYNDLSDVKFKKENLQSKLFDLILFLVFFLNKRDYEKMVKELDEHIAYYFQDITTISIKDFYMKMGCLTSSFSELLIKSE